MEVLRKCRVCGLEITDKKDLELFYKDKTCKYNRDTICKKCANKQRYKSKAKRQKRYQWEAIQLLGGKCEACGKEATLDTMVCFDFHHREDSKRNGDATMSYTIQSKPLEVILEEAQKCILFCACCHRLHHQKYGY